MTDEELIKSAFEDLLASLPKNTTEENKQKVIKAFKFANEAHQGVRRRSGEPYILHPISVAKIVTSEIGLGTTSVISSMLHDVVEDTDYTVEDIESLFGPKIASIVDGLTKISEVMSTENRSIQAESFRKILLTLAEDVRVILIKIADRLHNMRTLSSMPMHKQIKIAGETLYIYAPLAHRMGLHAIKTELEDLSLKYEHPEEYKVIADKIRDYERENTLIYENFIEPIKESLNKNGYKHTITARTKSVYSVWNKMQRRNIGFDEIYDILAVRIVFEALPELPEKWQCWNIYSLITDLYNPKPERIRDWVSTPKANGYEALHLTVMGPTGQWIEVQIRSKRMDEIAEKGLAAHWKYKTDGDERNSELDKWLASMKEMLELRDANALDFLDDFKMNLYEKEIRLFTPKGYMKTLPKGATALDFAYEIHTEIGDTCIGAKVNHKLVPMSHKLQSGDQVEILTSDKQRPQREWLDFVVTAKAKSNIMAAFRRDHKELVRYGIHIFESIIKELELPPTSEPLKKILTHFKLKNKEDLYVSLAEKNITKEEIVAELKQRADNKFMKYWKLQFFRSNKNEHKDEEKHDSVAGDEIVVSPCCNPIPGDDVVGISMGGKVMVHKRKCPEAIRLMASHGDKIVPVEWVTHKVMSFPAIIQIKGIDRIGIVNDVTGVISKESDVNMQTVHFDTKNGIFEGILHIYIHNTKDLNSLIAKIADIEGVKQVNRIENQVN
ncbi:MAG: RelA/SpoT family protein [Culturomica sp.]|jgi:GTP pyrophosphokinase|nr:RelA/SpoT family protein [Culturomica sp.]